MVTAWDGSDELAANISFTAAMAVLPVVGMIGGIHGSGGTEPASEGDGGGHVLERSLTGALRKVSKSNSFNISGASKGGTIPVSAVGR
jgi:hypothetical protein